MKGSLLVVGAMAVLLLSGCTAQKYRMEKPGITSEQAMQDDAKCQNQAALIQVADWEYRGTFAEGANIQIKQQNAYKNCMVGKGYYAVPVS